MASPSLPPGLAALLPDDKGLASIRLTVTIWDATPVPAKP
jgi:hypothetical protein